jgi:general stress protein 26
VDDERIKQIIVYMSKCPACTIATVSPDGEPSASIVYFSNFGLDIYFNTARESQKVKNIIANPRVAVTMQTLSDVKTDRQITGIQYYGKAKLVSDNDIAEVPKPVMARNRAFNSSGQENSVMVKIVPTQIYFIDYSKGFRHRDVFQF